MCSKVHWIGVHPLNSAGIIPDKAIVMSWFKFSADIGAPHGKLDLHVNIKKTKACLIYVKNQTKTGRREKRCLETTNLHHQTLNSSPGFFCVFQDKRSQFLSLFCKQETVTAVIWSNILRSLLSSLKNTHRQKPTSTPNMKAVILMLSP